MNGKDTASLGSVPSVVARPRGAFISYANDADGQRMARALVGALRKRNCDAITDHDLPTQNPLSVAAWMEEQINARVDICVITPEYVRAFEETVEEGASKRKGVRYELQAIRMRIYDHEGRYGCPVIPVAPPDFPLDRVPKLLRGPNISWFDPDTGDGADELAERIAALEGKAPSTMDRRRFRRVLHELEHDLPAEKAIELVREGLDLAEDPALSQDLVPAFPQLADVIKDHGQISLMRVLTDRCLDALREKTPLLYWERELEARLLICGKAWYLQRDHRLREALDHAQEGISLAERHGLRRVAAYGRQCVGRIQRLLAEDAHGKDVDHYLSLSAQTISEAVALFHAIDGDHPRRSEAGASLNLGARTQLTRHRMLGDSQALTAADAMAQEAAGMLTPEQKKDRHDLAILRAEISAAGRRYADGRKRLSEVIESLVPERGAHSEVLARAYVARANHIAPRGARAEIIKDLDRAREIFESQQQTYAVAACDWEILMTDPRAAKVGRADLLELARLVADPRVRLAAVAKLSALPDPRRPVDWAALIDRGLL